MVSVKRCQGCSARAYLADIHCQRCGAAIIPPPPAWLVGVGRVFWVLVAIAFPFKLCHFAQPLLRTEHGRAAMTALRRLGLYVMANGADIAGILFAFVVAPLIGLYFAFKAMVDLGDAIDLKVQKWRAERFRKYGW